jgi:UDP-3-O-[3-hydroxymyristoyl] glucosamine N-acyltransferase
MSQVLEMFAHMPVFAVDIHPSVVDNTALVWCKIGAGCYIGPDVKIGANAIIYPNVTILDASTVGNNTVIWSGSVVRERCHIGNDCIIHPNATGADGFGLDLAQKED